MMTVDHKSDQSAGWRMFLCIANCFAHIDNN